MSVSFDRSTKGLKELATYVAQLVREGVVYEIKEHGMKISVELTGGY